MMTALPWQLAHLKLTEITFWCCRFVLESAQSSMKERFYDESNRYSNVD